MCSNEKQIKRSHHGCHSEAQRTGLGQIVPICWDKPEDPKTMVFVQMLIFPD